jgi:hypothetical protein
MTLEKKQIRHFRIFGSQHLRRGMKSTKAICSSPCPFVTARSSITNDPWYLMLTSTWGGRRRVRLHARKKYKELHLGSCISAVLTSRSRLAITWLHVEDTSSKQKYQHANTRNPRPDLSPFADGDYNGRRGMISWTCFGEMSQPTVLRALQPTSRNQQTTAENQLAKALVPHLHNIERLIPSIPECSQGDW